MRMTKITTKLASSALAIGMIAGGISIQPSYAAAENRRVRQERPEKAKQRAAKPRQVQGTVIAMKTVDVRGLPEDNVVVLIKPRKGAKRLVVDLGPESEAKQLRVRRGTQIAAMGPVIRIGNEQLLVADRVRANRKVVQIKRLKQEQQHKQAHSAQRRRAK